MTLACDPHPRAFEPPGRRAAPGDAEAATRARTRARARRCGPMMAKVGARDRRAARRASGARPMTDAAAIAAALALVAAGAQHAPGPWILTCNMAGPGEGQNGPQAHRMFRIGPHLFQAWNPEKKAFGRNL